MKKRIERKYKDMRTKYITKEKHKLDTKTTTKEMQHEQTKQRRDE